MKGGSRLGLAAAMALCLAGMTRAADEARVKEAIGRGLNYLRAQQREDGSWPFPSKGKGATALAALTLLECGAPVEDAAVQKAAAIVRQAAVEETQTYAIATTILFLDRLHDPRDDLIIQWLSVRLMRGQQADECWGYDCLPPLDEELRQLRANVRARTEGIGEPNAAGEPESPGGLPTDIEAQIRKIKINLRGRKLETGASRNRTDHSNTQFAVLALWVARRRGMPVEGVLRLVAKHFRDVQNADGGWSYLDPLGGQGPLPSEMGGTCAALLGLTLGHASNRAVLRTPGVAGDRGSRATGSVSRDPAIVLGLQYLGSLIGPPLDKKIVPSSTPHHYYAMLWSLERVAVVYGLPTIGHKDWYSWGAQMILASQEQDGSWDRTRTREDPGGKGEPSMPIPDTCFALLFLRRSNLVQDLTDVLRGHMKDPGKAALRAGGVGGATPLPAPISGASGKQEPFPPLSLPPPRPGTSGSSGTVTPEPVAPVETRKLVDRLLQAGPDQQIQLIEAYREGKGGAFTEALGDAIRRLEGETRERARDALAVRLTRMSAETLRDKMRDDNAEVRGAACLAAGMREDPKQVPDLIGMLRDADPRVVQAAHVALKNLTGEDFGPKPGATAMARAAAIRKWAAWWQRHQK